MRYIRRGAHSTVFGSKGFNNWTPLAKGTDAILTPATEPPSAGTDRFVDRFGPVPS